ncbi:MAG: WD40 repeat domain-containing protein [Pirellulaceae bacterium]
MVSVYHKRLPLLLAAILCCLLPLRGQELEAPLAAYPPELLAEVERLVNDLSGESYAAREAAGRRLLNIGEAAWDRVFEASQSANDLELRYRAAELLKTLQKKKFMPIRVWEEHKDIVWAVAFSPDGRYLASGGGGLEMNGTWTEGSDFSVRIWSLKDGSLHKKLDGHKNAITALAWFADSSRLVSSSSDNTAKIWSVADGKEVATLLGHTDRVSGVAVSEDGTRILTGSWDKTCILYDARTGKAVKQLDPPHYGRIWSVALSPDGKTAAVAGDHPQIRLWDLENLAIKKELQGHSQAAVALAFSAKGDRLVSGGWDNTAIVWDLEKGMPSKVLTGNAGRVEGIAISTDGKRVLTGSLDQKVRLFDADSGQLLQTYDGHTGGIGKVALSKNGKYAASGSWDHSVRLWPMPK